MNPNQNCTGVLNTKRDTARIVKPDTIVMLKKDAMEGMKGKSMEISSTGMAKMNAIQNFTFRSLISEDLFNDSNFWFFSVTTA